MLIRICDHFHNNPKRIDKLIAIKGLPDKWFFIESPEGRQLRKPWEPDVDKNIPSEIRNLCDPMYVILRYSPIQAGAKEVIEKRQILGVRIDYNSEPGRQMWDDIERYIEETMPRNERIPVPVLCARDERAAFDTYVAKRNTRGSLELTPSPVPYVDLTQYVVKVEVKPVEVLAPEPLQKQPTQDSEFKCDECDYHHGSQAGIRMHKTSKHRRKEKVSV